MHLGKDNLFACLRVRLAASLAGVVMYYSVLPRRPVARFSAASVGFFLMFFRIRFLAILIRVLFVVIN